MSDQQGNPKEHQMKIFVILTVQKAAGHTVLDGHAESTLTWTLTPGPDVDRAGLLDFVLQHLVPEHLRGGVVLFYSAEPLSFSVAASAADGRSA